MKSSPKKEDDRDRRLFNLKTAFDQKLDSMIEFSSKHEARATLTNELRDAARAVGMTEEEAQRICAKQSDGLHWDRTIDQYEAKGHRFVR